MQAMRLRHHALVITFFGAAVGCGTTNAEEKLEKSDAMTIEASPTTRSELGVVAWTVQPSQPQSSLKGYAEDDHVLIEFARSIRVDEAALQRREQYVLKQGAELARLVLAIDGDLLTVVESSFAEKYRRTMDLMTKDFEAAQTESIGSTTTADVVQHAADSLRPRGTPQLVDMSCSALVTTCYTPILIYSTAQARIPAVCFDERGRQNACEDDEVAVYDKVCAELLCQANMMSDCAVAKRNEEEYRNLATACQADPRYVSCYQEVYGRPLPPAPEPLAPKTYTSYRGGELTLGDCQ